MGVAVLAVACAIGHADGKGRTETRRFERGGDRIDVGRPDLGVEEGRGAGP
jgi:hypothetical protein